MDRSKQQLLAEVSIEYEIHQRLQAVLSDTRDEAQIGTLLGRLFKLIEFYVTENRGSIDEHPSPSSESSFLASCTRCADSDICNTLVVLSQPSACVSFWPSTSQLADGTKTRHRCAQRGHLEVPEGYVLTSRDDYFLILPSRATSSAVEPCQCVVFAVWTRRGADSRILSQRQASVAPTTAVVTPSARSVAVALESAGVESDGA